MSQLEVADLLTEMARQLTRLLDCGFCTISAYDEQTAVVTTLADYDDRGEPFVNGAAGKVYQVAALSPDAPGPEERVTALVNVSDPAADPDEVRELRREDDKSLLMVPLVYRGRSIGLLELVDHLRERRYTRQELRLCTAIAGQAAVALHNAQAFSAARQTDQGASALETALGYLGENLALLEDANRLTTCYTSPPTWRAGPAVRRAAWPPRRAPAPAWCGPRPPAEPSRRARRAAPGVPPRPP